MMKKTKKYVKPFFTVSVGFLLLHFLSSECSQIAGVPFSPPPSKALQETRRMPLQARERKIVEILADFKTGLKPEQKRRLAIFIDAESRRHGFDPELIVALIFTESSFYNWSTSPQGAIGLMQIIPTTGKELAETHDIAWEGEGGPLFDPFINIQLGIHYLRTLRAKFGDLRLALTAYNYGPTSVLRWVEAGEEIPYGYAEKVLSRYEAFLDRSRPDRFRNAPAV